MSSGRRIETTSLSLHVIAMASMLCDHLWATVVPGNDWLICVGRLAFPIFAFLIVEGYVHTGSLRCYAGRLLLCAILSEIPFDLVMGGTVFYPFHQNVLWTFLIALFLIWLNERARSAGRRWLSVLAGIGTVALGWVLGLLSMADYQHAGVLMVLAFYFFRGRKWWCFAGQALSLAWINLSLLGGYCYSLSLAGHTVLVPRQGWALLALLPIWLYRGRQGPHGRGLRLLFYAFYPVHLLVLALIVRMM